MTKAQNNPQGLRVLVNEFVSAALGRRFGAAVQPASVLEVPQDVAQGITHGSGATWSAGPSFASELMDKAAVYAPAMLADARDRIGLAKVPVLDTWIGINDGRQARGLRVDNKYDIRAVDFGHSLGNPNWTAADLQGRLTPTAVNDPNGWLAAATADEREQIAADIESVTDEEIDTIVAAVPNEWGLTADERQTLAAYLKDRRTVLMAIVATMAGNAP
jgi:hypothetical protein